ncbi:MAG: hypothetical protein ACO1PM_08735 [Acidovorax sp.]
MSALSLSEIYAQHLDGEGVEPRQRHAPKRTRKPADNGAVLRTDSETVAQAKQARAQGRWADAARLFTAAADQLTQHHGVPCATALALRRDAHLCLGFTQAFKTHRAPNTGKVADISEWQRPSGDLVRRLVGTRSPA